MNVINNKNANLSEFENHKLQVHYFLDSVELCNYAGIKHLFDNNFILKTFLFKKALQRGGDQKIWELIVSKMKSRAESEGGNAIRQLTRSTFMNACSQNRPDVTKILIDSDFLVTDTELYDAVSKQNVKIAELYLKKIPFDTMHFHCANDKNDYKMLDVLFKGTPSQDVKQTFSDDKELVADAVKIATQNGLGYYRRFLFDYEESSNVLDNSWVFNAVCPVDLESEF